MPYVLPDNPEMVDITNQYVWEGLIGGLLTMILFIVLIARCFQGVGMLSIPVSNKIMDIYLSHGPWEWHYLHT